jgi:hypothetical protein
MSEHSNIGDIMAWLAEFADGFNFTRVGADQSLGRDMANKVVERIIDRSLTDRRGINGEWDDNSTTPSKRYARGYKQYKEEEYRVDQPNVRTGQMLDQLSLYGRTTIDDKLITMKYGLDAVPSRTSTGVALKKADLAITDVQKAYFAHTGQSHKKIKRPFYEVDESDGAAVVELAQENLNGYIMKTNADNGY